MIHSRYLSSQSLDFKRDDFRTDSIPSSSLDLEGHISTVNDASIKQADWDVSKLRDKRCRDIEVQAGSISNEKLSELIAKYEVTYLGFYGSHGYLASSSLMLLLKAPSKPVQLLLESGAIKTWESIRNLLKHETGATVEGLRAAVIGFELDQSAFDEMVQNLRAYARSVCQKCGGIESKRGYEISTSLYTNYYA
ncbi:hypothetical protein AgCh_008640 [Apium graveolens]